MHPFNSTYTFFNNKDNNNISFIKIRLNKKCKKTNKNVEKINTNLSNNNYQNIQTKLYNYSLSK